MGNNKSILFSLLRRFFQFAESVRLLELLNFLAIFGHFAVYCSLKLYSSSSSIRFLFV